MEADFICVASRYDNETIEPRDDVDIGETLECGKGFRHEVISMCTV